VARVLLTQAIHPAAQARLQSFAEVVLAPGTGLSTLRACAAGCAVVIVRAQLPPDIFEAAPTLLGAVRHGAGVDMIPVDAATAHGVLVANVPGVNANAVAEHVLRSMLELARRSRDVARELASGRSAGWARARALADIGVELQGRCVGVVGFGHVGQAIARIARHGFGMEVLATTRSTTVDPLLATARDLDSLLAASDFVVLACPLTDATRGLIGAAQLERMRPGAFVVNVARGPVVRESALIDALRSRRIAGAALDVFDAQPPPDEHPYWQLPQVLMTPHVAGLSEDSMLAMGTRAVDAVTCLLRGELPPHCVNPQALPAFTQRWAASRGA
jgi:D-3-phosphoglycerate dehydrogenase